MPSLATLLAHLPDLQYYQGPPAAEVSVTAALFDSRSVTAGTLFVAWLGRNVDTHRFIPQAIEKGAAAIIGTATVAELEALSIQLPTTVPYIQVADSRRALAICAAALHDFPSQMMTVIGITGTDGKTTTCAILESILSAHTANTSNQQGQVGLITTVGARIRGVERDTGFHVTTPDAPDVQRFLAAMRDDGCSHAIVETTSHGLAQARVAAVAYDIAAVTNITHEHLDEHGTRDAYVAAKALLFRALYETAAKSGVPRCAILNADDVGEEHGEASGSYDALRNALAEEAEHRDYRIPIRTYGLADFPRAASPLPDLSARDIDYAPDSTHLVVDWWGGSFPLTTQLIGDFNVYNILCAVTISLVLEVPVATIQSAIAHFHGVLGRMERMDGGQPFLAVVDFAHSPVSLERALHTLRKLVGTHPNGEPGRLIALFGSAGLRDRAKRRLMGRVGGRLADYTVITAEDPRTEDLAMINREIAAGVEEFTTSAAYTIVPDRTEAIQYAVDMAQPGDVVAAFGKGHERSMCFGEIEYPWSDQEAMLTALVRRMQK